MGPKGSIFLTNLILWTLIFVSPLSGQEIPRAEVEVNRQVRFNYGVRPPGGGDRWLEIQVPINVRGPDDASSRFNPNYVDQVKVELMVAFEVGAGSAKRLRYYRSQMEIATLPRGRHILRFYLPPAIIERDRMSSDPLAYVVDLSVEGRPQPSGRNGRVGFSNEATFNSFIERMGLDAPRTDGTLIPIYLSPFADAYPRETYAFVRRPGDF